MSIYTFRRTNPIIPTTAIMTRNDNSLLLATNDFASTLSTPKFIIQLDQTVPYGVTYPAIMSLAGISDDYITLYDRLGYYIRSDRLYRAMQMRKNGCIYYNCSPNEFQCVIRYDPLRIVMLDPTPPSVYTPTVTTTTIRAVEIPSSITDGSRTVSVDPNV